MFLKVSLDTEVTKDSHRSQCLLLFLCIYIYYIDSAFLENSNANPSGFQMTRGNTQTGEQGPLYSEDLSLLKKEMSQELWNSLLSCLKNKILKQTNSYLLYSQTCRLLRENEEHSEYPRVDKVQLWMCLRKNIKDFFNYKDFLTDY